MTNSHSPSDTKVEDWAPTTRKFLRQFIPKCHTNGNCVGCDADMDAIINSISSLIEKVRQEEAEKVEDLSSALISMYGQYCGDEWGHSFMSAGEEASFVLEKYGYMKFDKAGRIINPPSHPSV